MAGSIGGSSKFAMISLNIPCARSGVHTPPCDLPTLVVFPVAQEGLVKRRRIAILRVLNAKEVPVVARPI